MVRGGVGGGGLGLGLGQWLEHSGRHQCSLGEIPVLNVICAFVLLVLFFLLNLFLPGLRLYHLARKPTLNLICMNFM